MSIKARVATVAIGALCLTATMSTTSAHASGADLTRTYVSYEEAVPGVAPVHGAVDDAVYLDGHGRVLPGYAPAHPAADPADLSAITAIGCTPESGRDNPHYSGGDVSGHGWWKKGTCTAATATVYNCLYEYYTDNSWRQKACATPRSLRPYTGSGDRTVARATCNSTGQMISWRNHVDVDVDGQIDTGEQPMNQADVACVVY